MHTDSVHNMENAKFKILVAKQHHQIHMDYTPLIAKFWTNQKDW